MHPTLINIFSFPVPSYGTMLALSFLTGIFLSMYIAKKRGLDPEIIADLGIYIIISAVVGARLYYVMTHYGEFRGNLLSIVNPFQNGSIGISGLVMYGGFIAAIITAAAFFYFKKLPVLRYLDVYTPGVGIGIALTRIGCFLNGCCFGAPAEGSMFQALAINYPRNSPAGYYQHVVTHASGLIPSQFLESAGGLVMAATLLLVGKSKLRFDGMQFYLMIVMYAVLRFFIENTRYIETTRIGPFSHNQIICMVLFPVFCGLIVRGLIAQKKALK